MSKIIFVCTGNTCRSPMAAALYSRICPQDEVTSAGLYADGSAYCENSIEALAEIGINLSGNSRQLTPEDTLCDTIFVMTESHKATLELLGVSGDKITVLNVSDPFMGDMARYRACRDEIARKLCELTIEVRPMQREDIPEVATLESECFSSPWSKTALEESLEGDFRFFVAVANNKILGYAGMQTVLDEAYVTNVAVFPQYRRFGIATRLINYMGDFCQNGGYAFLTLEVRSSNQKAISVYEKAGFKSVGTRKNFYQNPTEDAVLMTKEFEQ